MSTLFITVIDSAGAFTIPSESLERLNWRTGTQLLLRETTDGFEIIAAN
ncbi:MAG TPA: AbrB/MazE/SpoVT family DNA-binding domain-containing protein [Microbacteriaceae bacterium]|nr:AbrB/MazE/SpoVT family DNA-binding domain-containing protein [Microbacteriaceae bacterium]